MLVVLIIFLLAFGVQVFFFGFFFSRLAFYKGEKHQPQGDLPPVSVIICARNEAENLQRFLPEILQQHYPDIEVVVVNDHSTDNTASLLKQLQQRHPQLTVVLTDTTIKAQGKRAALISGIRAAKHELILLSDADCRPLSRQYISSMVQGFKTDKDIVLGFSPYRRQRGLLNAVIRYETFYTALQYFSFALAGLPYMGVGRNLGYKKAILQQGAVIGNTNLAVSGDDDLPVNRLATAENTSIVLSPESHMESVPETSWRNWLWQKRRHSTSGYHYRAKHKVLLALLNGSQVVFNAALLVLLFSPWWPGALIIFLTKMLLQYIIFGKAMKVLKQTALLPLLLFWDFTISVFLVTLGALSIVKVHAWSRRKTSQTGLRKIWN